MRKRDLPYWEFDPTTRDLKPATWKRGAIFISAGPEGSETTETMILSQVKGCIYFQAMNLENAKRKADKM